MLFHDRRTGTLVPIDHQDLLPNEKAMSMYTSVAGAQGQNDVSAPSYMGMDGSAPSKTAPGLTNDQHMAIAAVHKELTKRASHTAQIEAMKKSRK